MFSNRCLLLFFLFGCSTVLFVASFTFVLIWHMATSIHSLTYTNALARISSLSLSPCIRYTFCVHITSVSYWLYVYFQVTTICITILMVLQKKEEKNIIRHFPKIETDFKYKFVYVFASHNIRRHSIFFATMITFSMIFFCGKVFLWFVCRVFLCNLRRNMTNGHFIRYS